MRRRLGVSRLAHAYDITLIQVTAVAQRTIAASMSDYRAGFWLGLACGLLVFLPPLVFLLVMLA